MLLLRESYLNMDNLLQVFHSSVDSDWMALQTAAQQGKPKVIKEMSVSDMQQEYSQKSECLNQTKTLVKIIQRYLAQIDLHMISLKKRELKLHKQGILPLPVKAP
jgi:hypothetical protein